MSANTALTRVIIEGDSGTYAECREFGISVGATSRAVAEQGLEQNSAQGDQGRRARGGGNVGTAGQEPRLRWPS